MLLYVVLQLESNNIEHQMLSAHKIDSKIWHQLKSEHSQNASIVAVFSSDHVPQVALLKPIKPFCTKLNTAK